jgi:hypothetical protein
MLISESNIWAAKAMAEANLRRLRVIYRSEEARLWQKSEHAKDSFSDCPSLEMTFSDFSFTK